MGEHLAITNDGMMRGDDRQRLRAVANQLEGAFIKQLLKNLEDSPILDEPLLGGSNASRQFGQLFHEALGEKAAGRLGLADSIFAQLAARIAIDKPEAKP